MRPPSRRRPPRPGQEGKAGEVRPVGARALKSAGDTLRPYLADARVLDLFAGQGRFGTMALEEGAASVVFVERDRERTRQLTRALERYRDRATVRGEDVFTFLARATDRYDLVFADPPFPDWNDSFSARLFTTVTARLNPGAILLVKFPKRVVPSSAVWTLEPWKTTPFGESSLRYYRTAE